MPTFVWLTDKFADTALLVNVDAIREVWCHDGETFVVFQHDGCRRVRETPEYIEELIQRAHVV